MSNENKLQDIIKTSLESLRTMVDGNTVIGDPINTPTGTTIIPISKISMGFASGGLDYNSKNEKNVPSHAQQNFGGGGGTGLTVSPVGFLVISKNGTVEMINVGAKEPSDPIEQIANIIERSPDIIERLKNVFKKDSSKQTEEIFNTEE